MAVFLSLWSIFVYSPMAHMVWGVGGLLNATGNHIPSLDFAGGTVVHITSGVSALVCALYLGKRIGYPLVLLEVIRELGQDPSRERDVARLDLDVGGRRERAEDR